MMISNHDRRFATPINTGPPNKRKTLDGPKGPNGSRPIFKRPNNNRPGPTQGPIVQAHKNTGPVQNNQILAGYLAHEFLTKGSLFGELWDPARAEAVPVSADSRREKDLKKEKQTEPSREKRECYVAVSGLLKTDAAHLPGVINPTQLRRFLQL